MPAKSLWKWMMSVMVFLYRATKGRIGGRVANLPTLVLNSTGRKSGRPHTVILGFFQDGENYIVTASNAGFDKHPAWYWNLTSHPETTIEIKDQKVAVRAEVAGPDQKPRLWAQLLRLSPGYQNYQQRTSRDIPMVILRPGGGFGTE